MERVRTSASRAVRKPTCAPRTSLLEPAQERALQVPVLPQAACRKRSGLEERMRAVLLNFRTVYSRGGHAKRKGLRENRVRVPQGGRTSITFLTRSMSFARSSPWMMCMSSTGSTLSSTCVMSGSSKVRRTWKIPSTAEMFDRNAFPRPSPCAAPLQTHPTSQGDTTQRHSRCEDSTEAC